MLVLIWLVQFGMGHSVQAADCAREFGNHDLNSWLQARDQGLILVVSDGMPYSQKSVALVTAEAKKRKLAVLVLSDRIGRRQTERCDAVLKASELISRGALRHFPTLFAVKKHTLQPKVVPGIQTQNELNLWLDEMFR